MSYLKNINDFDSQEISSMEDFRFFTEVLLFEANHVSNVTDYIIQDIYAHYLELIEDYEKNNVKKEDIIEVGQVIFSGWAFNEYAENPDEIFYQTNPEDETHHRIYLSIFNPQSAAISRFEGRFKKEILNKNVAPKDIVRLIKEGEKDDDILIISVAENFIFRTDKHFTGHVWLNEKIAHEMTHLYRSAIVPHTNHLLSKKNDLQFKFANDLKEYKHMFEEIDVDLYTEIISILYNFDFNEQDARLKELDTHMKEILKREDYTSRIHQQALDYIKEHFKSDTWNIDKISLITALSQTADIKTISHINIMHNMLDDLHCYSYSEKFPHFVKFYVLGYYLYKSGHLYTKELKNRYKISPSMIGDFFSKKNYEFLLKEKDVDNMTQAKNIYHFFAAVEDSLKKIFLQYQVHVYTIIDRYIYQIFNIDESVDDELIADCVFERDLNFSKRSISLCREIYETENYYRNPKNTPYNVK